MTIEPIKRYPMLWMILKSLRAEWSRRNMETIIVYALYMEHTITNTGMTDGSFAVKHYVSRTVWTAGCSLQQVQAADDLFANNLDNSSEWIENMHFVMCLRMMDSMIKLSATVLNFGSRFPDFHFRDCQVLLHYCNSNNDLIITLNHEF
jgi:hypothetical protein